MDFLEERDLPYTDAEGFEIIRQAYAKVDFEGDFIQTDSKNDDEYIIHFSKLLDNTLPFLNMETGKETWEYIFFDIDDDSFPELGIKNENDHNAVYILTIMSRQEIVNYGIHWKITGM